MGGGEHKSTEKDRLRAPTYWLTQEHDLVLMVSLTTPRDDMSLVSTELSLPINFQNAILMERRRQVSEALRPAQ
jgi:hypothetical protein